MLTGVKLCWYNAVSHAARRRILAAVRRDQRLGAADIGAWCAARRFAGAGLLALVLDDNAASRQALADLLRGWGSDAAVSSKG